MKELELKSFPDTAANSTSLWGTALGRMEDMEEEDTGGEPDGNL